MAAATSPDPPDGSPTPHASPTEELEMELEGDNLQFADGDSAIDIQSSGGQSLTSSVLDFPVEHGRRYHAVRPGTYIMPNDEPELARLDFMHDIFVKLFSNRLFLAPVDLASMSQVLDMGTGTGIWAMEIADRFPNLTIVGNDLSPVQPAWVPSNVHFVVDDLEMPWRYDTPFDFVFGRYLLASIEDWPKLVGSAYENIRPGGWIELEDFDMAIYSEDGPIDGVISEWFAMIINASSRIGREHSPGPKLEGWLTSAGFERVMHRQFKIPVGEWPEDVMLKEVGFQYLAQMVDGLEAFSLRLMCDVLDWKIEDVWAFLDKVAKEFLSKGRRLYMNFHVAYGQKPLS